MEDKLALHDMEVSDVSIRLREVILTLKAYEVSVFGEGVVYREDDFGEFEEVDPVKDAVRKAGFWTGVVVVVSGVLTYLLFF